MNKKFLMKNMFALGVIILGIVFLQFYRLENINEYFAPIKVAKKEIETMSHSSGSAEGEKIKIFIYQDGTKRSHKISENLKHSLDYAKIPYEKITDQQIGSLQASPYHLLVLTGHQTDLFPYETIRNFVEEGGRLVITDRIIDVKWNELVGIKSQKGLMKDPIYGLHFEKTIFPGYEDLSEESWIVENKSLDVVLDEDTEVYITAEKTPVLWKNTYEKGEVVYWNATMFHEEHFRGLLLQSIGVATPAFVTAQVGAKVMFIDDFPAPVPEGSSKSISKDYDLTVSQFYKNIWWEDMKELAKDIDLAYTGLFIGTYRDDDKLKAQDLIFNGRETMTFYGRQLLENNGEIGLHGYNHQSLVTGSEPMDSSLGYRRWDSQEQMEKSLQTVKEFYNYYFPNQTFQTYVPPSNVLNRTGLDAIVNKLPNITTIASLYDGSLRKGDFVQEYEFDRKYSHLYHFPRISSDYNFNKDTEFVMKDAIANFGMISHFIHPDDVLDPRRAKKDGWPEMKEKFSQTFKELKELYPHLEPLTAQQATEKMIHYQEATLDVSYTAESIIIQGTNLLNPTTLLVRLEQGKKLQTGSFQFGEVKELDTSSRLYAVKLTKPEAKLKIRENAK